MTIPLRHAADRFGRIPALVVGPLGCHRVVDIADCTHLRKQTDFAVAQFMRVAAAVDFFVVVQADIERDVIGALRLQQQGVAGHWMLAHHVEFSVGEFAGFVENVVGGRRLADVVQQTGDARAAYLVVRQLHLPRQRDHQCAHGDGVHVGVIVFGFQPRQADQRTGVTRHRRGNILHQRCHAMHVDGLAHPHFAEHRVDRLLAGETNAGRALQLLVHRHPLRCDRRQIDWHRRLACRRCDFVVGIGGHIEPAADIDADTLDAGRDELAYVFVVFEQETLAPERAFDPRTADFADVHAAPQLAHFYPLLQGQPRYSPAIILLDSEPAMRRP